MKRTVRRWFWNHSNASTLQQDHSAKIPKLIEILILLKAQVESSLKCAVTLINPVGILSYHVTTSLAGVWDIHLCFTVWYWGALSNPNNLQTVWRFCCTENTWGSTDWITMSMPMSFFLQVNFLQTTKEIIKSIPPFHTIISLHWLATSLFTLLPKKCNNLWTEIYEQGNRAAWECCF